MVKELFFAQKAFVVHEQELLMVRKSFEDPKEPGKWEVPGGRMVFGETVNEHIRREVREEVGIDIRPGRPFYVWQWRMQLGGSGENGREVQVVAVARLCEALNTSLSSAEQMEDDYLAEMCWVPLSDIETYEWIENMLPVVFAFKTLWLGQ